ncbi:MAG: DUF4845 domain-containing protein [Burkholderiaceae bacterium]
MPAAPRRRQSGVSMILLLLIGTLLFIVGGAALRVAPTVLEYRSIQDAIDRSLEEGTAPLIRRSFNRAAAIDNITSLTGADLIIEMVDGKPDVTFEYEKRIPLAGPVSLVVDYRREGSTKP